MTSPNVIEDGQRLSQSHLWELQRAYFTRQGIAAWRDGDVPYYITNNPTIAKAYAQLIFAWLRDLATDSVHLLDPSQPIYLVELGAGAGKFAYHFLNYFLPLLESSVLRHLPFCYVMTDFTPAIVETWETHPQLKRFTSTGKLDFALFDAEQDKSLALLYRGETLAPETLKNPLAVIANYVLDGLRNDLFRIENGQLYESLVTLSAPDAKVNWTHLQPFNQLQIAYRHQPVEDSPYRDPADNQILQSYQQELQQTHFLFPVGALECLRRLRHFSKDRLLFIAGDKGTHLLADLEYRFEPGIVVHGSFSMTVNFHALGQYTLNAGGHFLCTPHRRSNLDICAFLFDATVPPDLESYVETRQAYDLAIIQGGPDDFYTVKKAIETQYGGMEIPQLLAYLRLNGWDSNIFIGCFLVIIEKLRESTDELKLEVDAAIQHVWNNYYYLGEDKDLPFALGLVSLGTQNYIEAAKLFQISLHLHGPDSSAYYYLGLAQYNLGALEQALASARASVEINPDFEPAQALEKQAQSELEGLIAENRL